MSEMVYVVGGDCGEYSDHCSWYVRIFLHKSAAEAFCERLNAWCRERKADVGCTNREEHPPEDPNFQTDYTGTEYSVVEVPLDVAETLPVSPTEQKTQEEK